MRILFLDDMLVRWELFKAEVHLFNPSFTTIYVQNSDDAISILKNQAKFDVVFLDHDLEDAHYVTGKGRSEKTGKDVAKFITTLPRTKMPDLVVIHSWNPDGAEAMKYILATRNIVNMCYPFEKGIANTVLTMITV